MTDKPEHFCGEWHCANPATLEIVARDGGTFGWLCADCGDELERTLTAQAEQNEARFKHQQEIEGNEEDAES